MASKRVRFVFMCEHIDHTSGSHDLCNVHQCESCSRYVCDNCKEQHVTTQQHVKTLKPCECTVHNKLQSATYGQLCDCGMYICEACLDIHALKSKFHRQ